LGDERNAITAVLPDVLEPPRVVNARSRDRLAPQQRAKLLRLARQPRMPEIPAAGAQVTHRSSAIGA
jgi:hypothetical protein